MSKKRFTEGLENLFGELSEEKNHDDNPLLKAVDTKSTQEEHKARRKARDNEKSFASSFDRLFEKELTEKVYEKVEEAREQNKKNKKRKRKSFRGLDNLIRETLEKNKIEVETPTGTKRVTIIFNQQMLDKLKSIARMENIYLKDIVNGVVKDYIHDYEDKFGELE